jgi:WD40 repeat protein
MDEKLKRRFRFSLRTLLIALLLAAAATGLKMHWAAWYPGATIPASSSQLWLFAPDDRRVAIFTPIKDSDKIDSSISVGIWDLRSGRLISEFSVGPGHPVFSHDGKRLLTEEFSQQDLDFHINVWDADSGTLLRTFVINPYDSKLVSITDNDGLVTSEPIAIWNARDGLVRVQFSHPIGRGACRDLEKIPDEVLPNLKQRYALLANASDIVQFEQIVQGQSHSVGQPELNVYSCISSNNQIAATSVYETGLVQLWDVTTGHKLISISLPDRMSVVEKILFSKDGTRLAIHSSSFPTFIFDSQTGALLSQLPIGASLGYFTDDGNKMIVSQQYDSIDNAIYDIKTGGCINHLRDTWAEFSGDGNRAVFGARGGIELHDLSDDTLLQTLPKYDVAWFYSAGDMLALHDSSHDLQVWHRRRPERWWGIFWLPEFWLTFTLCAALIWSLRRDWRGVL